MPDPLWDGWDAQHRPRTGIWQRDTGCTWAFKGKSLGLCRKIDCYSCRILAKKMAVQPDRGEAFTFWGITFWRHKKTPDLPAFGEILKSAGNRLLAVLHATFLLAPAALANFAAIAVLMLTGFAAFAHALALATLIIFAGIAMAGLPGSAAALYTLVAGLTRAGVPGSLQRGDGVQAVQTEIKRRSFGNIEGGSGNQCSGAYSSQSFNKFHDVLLNAFQMNAVLVFPSRVYGLFFFEFFLEPVLPGSMVLSIGTLI